MRDSNQNNPADGIPRFCPECGTAVIPGAIFCAECGWDMRNVLSDAGNDVVSGQGKKSAALGICRLILPAILIILLFLPWASFEILGQKVSDALIYIGSLLARLEGVGIIDSSRGILTGCVVSAIVCVFLLFVRQVLVAAYFVSDPPPMRGAMGAACEIFVKRLHRWGSSRFNQGIVLRLSKYAKAIFAATSALSILVAVVFVIMIIIIGNQMADMSFEFAKVGITAVPVLFLVCAIGMIVVEVCCRAEKRDAVTEYGEDQGEVAGRAPSSRVAEAMGFSRTADEGRSAQTAEAMGSSRTGEIAGSSQAAEAVGSSRTGEAMRSLDAAEAVRSSRTEEAMGSSRTGNEVRSAQTVEAVGSSRTADKARSARTTAAATSAPVVHVKTGSWKTALTIIIVVAVLGGGVFLLTNLIKPEPEPFDAIKRFEKAYNNLDYTAMAECIDPRVTELAAGIGAQISKALTGSGDADLAKKLLPLFGDYMSDYAREYWEKEDYTAHMTVTEISTEMVRDTKASVRCQIEVNTSDGGSYESEETIPAVKVDGEWYIALF